MHSGQGTGAIWLLWGMLLTGAGLALASLWHTSERFWYWKKAQQMAAGEVVPAEGALRVGQQLRLVTKADTGRQYPSDGIENFAATGMSQSGEADDGGMPGHVVGLSRGLLTLVLESQTITREEERAQCDSLAFAAGQSLQLQVTGDSEVFHFTATIRSVHPVSGQPSCTQVTVKLPLWLARIQRRQHVRASMQRGVTLQSADKGSTNRNDIEPLHGTLYDLSGGGLRLELKGAHRPDAIARWYEQWDKGTVVECSLDMPLLRDMPLQLRIRSCQRIAVRGGLSLRIRGEFVDLPYWQRETIISSVFEAQRQHLRSSPRFQTMA